MVGIAVASAGCGGPSLAHPPPAEWQFGFWFWQGSSASVRTASGPVDALFFQAGTISLYSMGGVRSWHVYGGLPESLPPAREYWAVFRSEDHQAVPPVETIAELTERMQAIQAAAKQRGLNLAGLQLDVDAPTRALPTYAAYLAAVRKALGPGVRISITALLDWFRPGTAMAQVAGAVDEFVPQFYDLNSPGAEAGEGAIAAPVDSRKWAPAFSRYGKRFRIGLSTFGRARLIPAKTAAAPGARVIYYRDVRPLDVAMNPDFARQAATNDARELVLTYRALRNTTLGYTRFERDASVEFVLSTPESLQKAVGEARQMGGLCAGVLFFRWPELQESLTAQPDEVLAAVGVTRPARAVELRTIDEQCAAVYCADLYLMQLPALLSGPVRYVVTVTPELEYFLPDEKIPAKMTGPSRIEFLLPPYGGRVQVHLGRAVTAAKAQYTLEVHPE